MNLRRLFGAGILLVLAAGLAACGDNPTSIPTPTTTKPTTTTPPVTTTNLPATATPTLELNTTPLFDPSVDRAIKAIEDDLKKTQNLEASDLEISPPLPRQFSDSSLGCPQEGTFYQQVITPGYIFVVKVKSTSASLEYHADMRGRVVQCIPKKP